MNKLIINKNDLESNINIIKKMSGKSIIIAVVKYNGYGLGLIEYTKFLIKNGIDFFAVASTEEAIKLRENFKKIKIINMSSTCIKEEIKEMIDNDIVLTIGSLESYELIKNNSIKFKKIPTCHIKVDTGLGRYGFLPNEIETIKTICYSKDINVEGIFSHFSVSFYDEKYTKEQFNAFMNIIKDIENKNFKFKIKHICNSAAFLQYKGMHLDAVRIGSAFLGRVSISNIYGLKKIGYFESEISEIKVLPKNHNIGYSNTYKTTKETKVAVVPAGSIDGINLEEGRNKNRFTDKMYYIYKDFKRDIKGYKHFVRIDNKEYEVIGGIDNSHMILDISGSDVKIGDKVIIEINPFFINPFVKREYR